jgi:hypothetical protein
MINKNPNPDTGPVFTNGQPVRYTGAFKAWGRVANHVPDRFERVTARWEVPRGEWSPRHERVCRYSLAAAPDDFVVWLAAVPKELQKARDFRWALDGVSDALDRGTIRTGNGCIVETLRAFRAMEYRETSKAIERWLAAQPDREPDYPEWLVPKGWTPPSQVAPPMDLE